MDRYLILNWLIFFNRKKLFVVTSQLDLWGTPKCWIKHQIRVKMILWFIMLVRNWKVLNLFVLKRNYMIIPGRNIVIVIHRVICEKIVFCYHHFLILYLLLISPSIMNFFKVIFPICVCQFILIFSIIFLSNI